MSISAKIRAWAERFRAWLLAPLVAEMTTLRAEVLTLRSGSTVTFVGAPVLEPKADRSPCEFGYAYRQYHIKGTPHD